MKTFIHPAIDIEIIAAYALHNTPYDEERDKNVQILCNKLMYHVMIDVRFRKKLSGNPETARDTIIMFMRHWVDGGYLKSPMQHQQGMEGLIAAIKQEYETNPDHFEFTASSYLCDKLIRSEIIRHVTGQTLPPKQNTQYFVTQVLRSKFQQLQLF